MKYLLTFLFSFLLIANALPQNYKQVKINIQNLGDIAELQNIGLEFDHPHVTKDKAIVVFVDDEDLQKLQMTNFSYEILIDDWFDYYSKLPSLTESEKASFKQMSKDNYGVEGFGFGSMGGFYTLAEVITQLDSMKQNFPNLITTKVSIGNSIENRPMYMVKISDNPDIDETEPEILYTALHHAREPQGMMQMIYFMYYLLENYNTNPSVQYLVNNREMYFIPVLNPDGYEYNRTTNPNGGGLWRKNRKTNSDNSRGVDLNRNYGPYTYWNAPNGGSSTTPSSDTYRGTAPFSEPETTNLKNFLTTRYFKNALNYHTYSNLLIYPYGALEQETPDSAIFREFARDMTAYNGYTYGTDQQTVGYSTRGNSDDYFYDGDTSANHGKIFAMTPEVGSTGFWPSQPEIFPLAIENLMPNLYYAYVAGDYVTTVNPYFSQQYFNPGDNVELIVPQLRNKGLSDASNISLSLSSDNPLITVNTGTINIGNVAARTTVNNSQNFSFNIGGTMQADVNVKMMLTVYSSGTPMFVDTLSFITGTPIMVFADSTNDPLLLWNITSVPTTPKWEATTLSFHSSPTSFTDSKNGSYVSSATVTMTLKDAIDLSANDHPRLSFWTKFDIESGWDYGQVEISTNNGSTFVPLNGIYTTPGSGSFQPTGEPLYDGTQLSWVNEIMDLTNYNTNQVKLKFELRTDGSLTKDGWYVDDIGVIVYGIVPVELTSFTAAAQNNNVLLSWITSSETNNLGFDIERRSSDSNTGWQKIGFVSGKGTTTERSVYSFTDVNPAEGKSYYRLRQTDLDGSTKVFDAVEVDFGVVKEYSLSQNFPNPFNPETEIAFSLAKSDNVTLKIYNILGSEVATLVNGFMEAGKHSVKLNASQLTSGVYLYTIKSANFTATRKMILMK